MTSNAQITAELVGLHATLEHHPLLQSSPGSASMQGTSTTSSDGSGAGSREIYDEVRTRNWHGRLGRTTIAEVDRMLPVAREELDRYLHRTIKLMFPVGTVFAGCIADPVFATLAAFGLRLEDRGAFADGPIFTDAEHAHKPTTVRLQNYTAHFYAASTEKFEQYWKALAMETLFELARYRGLLTAEGFLKEVK